MISKFSIIFLPFLISLTLRTFPFRGNTPYLSLPIISKPDAAVDLADLLLLKSIALLLFLFQPSRHLQVQECLLFYLTFAIRFFRLRLSFASASAKAFSIIPHLSCFNKFIRYFTHHSKFIFVRCHIFFGLTTKADYQ